jgi:hypothetical protein
MKSPEYIFRAVSKDVGELRRYDYSGYLAITEQSVIRVIVPVH